MTSNLDNISDNMSGNSNPNRKRVTFSNFIEQRNLHFEEDKEYDHIPYDDIQTVPQLNLSNEEIITNISFEDSENFFVIEDCFYKFPHSLPRNAESLKFTQNFKEEEKEKIKILINDTISKFKDKINRIDGILITENKSVIVLTEFYLIEFKLEHQSLEFKQQISIQEIDYITLTRDGKKIIFHLIENKTYVINHIKLERVASSISASYFYDKTNYSNNFEHVNRQISVIILNEKFSIIKELEGLSNFGDYK